MRYDIDGKQGKESRQMGEMDELMNEEVMVNMTNALLSIIPISTTQ